MRPLVLALAAALAAATGVPLAQQPQPVVEVRALSPEDGEFVQGKVAFRLGLRGDGLTLADAAFRIVIEKEGSPPVVVDQKATAKKWALYRDRENPGAGYRGDDPLPDGAYTWHAEVRSGDAWIASERNAFTVDTVPPAAVGEVRFRRDPVKGTILVEWDPVTLDTKGAKEHEVKYRLYRYEPRPFFFGTLLNEMALTLEPRWEDKDPKAIHAPTLFYVVRAVDAAWNESDPALPASGI